MCFLAGEMRPTFTFTFLLFIFSSSLSPDLSPVDYFSLCTCGEGIETLGKTAVSAHGVSQPTRPCAPCVPAEPGWFLAKPS